MVNSGFNKSWNIKMKILQLGKFYPIRGGVEKVMYDIMSGLSVRGVSCDMLCTTQDRQISGEIQINEYSRLFCVPTIVILAATTISPAMILKLRRIRKDYDVIHIHHPDPMACMALFFSGYKGKVVLHWHSDILKQKVLLKFYAPFQRWLIKRADVIAGTTPVYVQQSPFLQSVQEKVTSIPIGILPIRSWSGNMNRIKEQYAGKKIIFSLGRLVEYKGFEYLIKAASILGKDYIFLIGGTGPLRDSLQSQINDLGISDRVILLGYVREKEIPDYFWASDLFVLSSIQKTEAFAIVQIEAMSCSTPIVATRIKESGVSWVNKQGVSGLNVPPRDPQSLADAIRRILSDVELHANLSRGALKRYQSLFTRSRMTDKCLALYENIMTEKRFS